MNVLREYRFHIGDLVRIRQWDDMVSQYGTSDYGIPTPGASFVHQMKNLCGREFIIDNFIEQCGRIFVKGHNFFWNITEYMIEPADEFEDGVYDSEEINTFLSRFAK